MSQDHKSAEPQMPDLSGALPARAVAVRPPQPMRTSSGAGVVVLLAVALAALLWWLAPALATDLRIGRDATAAADVEIVEANCRTRLFVLKVCNVALRDTGTPASPVRTLWYLYFGSGGQEPVVALRSPSLPQAVTTDLGLAKRWNRLLALSLASGLLVFCMAASLQVMRTAGRTLARPAAGRHRIVVVEIKHNNSVLFKRRMWTYVYDDGGRPGRASVEFASRDEPLFITSDRRLALAVKMEGTAAPLLLDAKLGALDLTDSEKAAFYKACGACYDAPALSGAGIA
jgi:hypothetical protein